MNPKLIRVEITLFDGMFTRTPLEFEGGGRFAFQPERDTESAIVCLFAELEVWTRDLVLGYWHLMKQVQAGKMSLFCKPGISVAALRRKRLSCSGSGLSVLTRSRRARRRQRWDLRDRLPSRSGGCQHSVWVLVKTLAFVVSPLL